MFKNSLTMALRQWSRRPGYAAINVVGLAVSLACCLLIGLYVRQELGFDRFHDDASNTFRVNWDYSWNNNEGVGPGTPPPLAARLLEEIPEVRAATRLYPASRMTVRHGETAFNESRIVGVDSNFFAFFDFPLREGRPQDVLSGPNRVVLTETTARRYFGDEPATGKQLTIGNRQQRFGRTYDNLFEVTGVVADPPVTSHLQFDLLTSMSSHPEVAFFDWSWVWMQVTTYVKLQDPSLAARAEAKIPDVVRTYAPDAFDRIGFSFEDLVSGGGHFDFVLQPLQDVYLGAVGNRLGPSGNRTYVYLFSTIAVFLLVIACVNYMNLATAQSVRRAREIGVRKVLGAGRGTLVGQFLMEAVSYSLLSLPLSVGLVVLAVGPFNRVAGQALAFHPFDSVDWLAALVGVALVVGIAAGSYPGFFLSSFRPSRVLKGTWRRSGSSLRMRHVLVVFQFTLTIGLLACTFLVQRQMNFLREADLGFDREGLVVVSNENNPLGAQADVFKARVEQLGGVQAVTVSTGVPPHFGFEDYFKVEGRGDEQIALISYMTDEDYLHTLGLELVQGRSFTRGFEADARSVIVNETAVRTFGWDDPIGKTVTYPGQGTYRVIGVMKDFNFMSLRAPVVPFALFRQDSDAYQIPDSYVVIRLEGTGVEESLRLVQKQWEAVVQDTPFEYAFLDEGFEQQYLDDVRMGRLLVVFSLLTVFVACMGLLGLSAFAAEQRTKEIGLRKVLGASVAGIVALLSRDFLRLILVALVISGPLAFWAMQTWLEDFAYRVEIGWDIFAGAGLLAAVIALLTVSYQAIRAALSDPVQTLRHE